MKRKKAKTWRDFPLLPIQRCPECRKVFPDLIKVGESWRRPAKKKHCSRDCARDSTRVGSESWFKRHRPHLNYTDFV
jgi:hypothetical protein